MEPEERRKEREHENKSEKSVKLNGSLSRPNFSKKYKNMRQRQHEIALEQTKLEQQKFICEQNTNKTIVIVFASNVKLHMHNKHKESKRTLLGKDTSCC